MLFVLIHTGHELSYAWNTCVEMRIIMNYRKQIKLALIALVLILCTQGKPAVAKAPKIPVVATEINGKQALDASGALQRSKKPGTKKNFQKKIFIGDSSSLTLLDDLDGYETTFKSSNPSILKVTKVSENTCDYYGMAASTATIQIRIRSTSGLFFMNRPTTLKAKVSVSPHAVSIKFKHSKYKITKSKTRKVRITLRPSITKEKPVYTVLNTRIATINKKGVLRGKRPGTTYVTATLANGVRAKCKIVVKSADK